MADDTEDMANVVNGIRRRAESARLSAYVIIAVLTAIGIATGFFFLTFVSGPSVVIGNGVNLGGGTVAIGGGLDWIPEITRAFIRIGSVIMAVFLINILVSFARYNLRVANYLESRADCIVLAKGETKTISLLLTSISVDPLDFTKTPMSPFDTYLDVVRSVLPGARRGAGSGKQRIKEDG